MTAFDRLHPALQHHIVNSLGWKQLRSLQDQAILPILEGKHALLLAPTAGGKTEAAIFPVLSRMLSENWNGLTVLYLCPIKALLNNLQIRLSSYCSLVGRTSGVWHGDIKDPDKKQILREPVDCLLTTPESIEVMLISRRVDKKSLFGKLRVVILDEVHSFAGDDRGWHLLSLLERLTHITGRELQRIGLSATVGSPDRLLNWMSGHCSSRGVVISPQMMSATPSVEIDYVGNLENAALVLTRLYRGEKRLVFCDSRSRVEELAARLRQSGVHTFVSHSSLGVEERRQAEEAFREGSDCVIVATSTLELGLDVGDLDRVIQIDAPTSVAAFLQRMGRTGRRPNTTRNCLFLATSQATLLRAAGLVDLWSSGYIEPVVPPPKPFHLFAQQLMALALQQQGIGRNSWREWIGRLPVFDHMPEEQTSSILHHMVSNGVLSEDEGILWLGTEGESTFGRRNFLELFSIFQSPPLFSVRHGRTELGEVHESSFLTRNNQRPVLLLAGRSWVTTSIDWVKRIAYVEPAQELGRSRWLGDGQPLSFQLCQAVRKVLETGGSVSGRLSHRAEKELAGARGDFDWLSPGVTALVRASSENHSYWWTFAGLLANSTLAGALRRNLGVSASADNLSIRIEGRLTDFEKVLELLRKDRLAVETDGSPEVEKAINDLKFGSCLPRSIAEQMFAERLADPDAVESVLAEPVKMVVQG